MGILTLNGGTVNAGQSIPVASITGGNFKFVPAADFNGLVNGVSNPALGSFTFQVQDDGGVAQVIGSGLSATGVDIDPTARTLGINVTSVNDKPVIVLQGTVQLPILKSTSHTFTQSDLGFTDPHDNPTNNLALVTVTATSGAGTFFKG